MIANKGKDQFTRREIIRAAVTALLFVILSVAVLEVRWWSSQLTRLQVGDVAPQDIIAPASISYESQVATEAARDQAAKLVQDRYTRPDPSVAREQRVVANEVFNYLDAVRIHPYLTVEQKLDYIQAIQPVSFSRQQAADVLNLNEKLWSDARREVDAILQEVMRQEIRETDLPRERFRLDLRVSADVPKVEADVIISIVEDLLRPNSFVDQARTEEARQAARDAVAPVVLSFERNESVIRAGELVDQMTIEALEQMGLRQGEDPWPGVVSTFLWLALLVGGLGYYISQYWPEVIKDNQQFGLILVMCFVFVIVIRAMVPGQEVLRYAVPMAALTITLAGTLDPRLSLIVTLMMGLIAGYVAGIGSGVAFELLTYVVVTGFVVILKVKRMAQVHTLLWAGLYAALSNVVVILLFRLFESDRTPMTTTHLLTIAAQVGNGLLSGVLAAGLALVAFLIVGNVTNIVTQLQLIELARPTHPLLAELLRRAPGTYHHSLLVSNLAEQAATRIGANAFLCRVGAYYHDVGKMVRPYFFTENTRPGVSLHDNLDPQTSAQVLISHVTEGLSLARKHHLPLILHACIAEHHGTEVQSYFYHQAIQAAGGDESKVSKNPFTYPGPKPQSKETAILMLADSSEATVRSVQPESEEAIDKIVRKTIENKLRSGQFDECDITMGELEQIRLAFNDVLQGVSHPRVKYPDQVKEEDKVDTGPLPSLPLAVQSTPVAVTGEPGTTTEKPRLSFPRD